MFLVGLNRILSPLTDFWVVWLVFGWFGWWLVWLDSYFGMNVSSQGNERHTLPAPERSISAEVPIPLFVEKPMTHRYQESKKEVPDTPQMSEIEEILRDQNDKLRDELTEPKA